MPRTLEDIRKLIEITANDVICEAKLDADNESEEFVEGVNALKAALLTALER